jgi:DNA-binding transcriptional LysR family regulator
MFDWNDLKLFVAVARTGSSQATANETGLSQATISRRISALERQLNVLLFTRDTTGFKLTPNGQVLISRAQELSTGLEAFEDLAERLQRSMSGKIKVTASHVYTSLVFMPIIVAFRRKHPAIDVEMITSNSFLDISREGIDLALRIGKRPDDPKLIARKVGNFGWGVYCSRRYAERFGAPKAPQELCEHDTLSYSGDFQNSDKVQWFEGLSGGKPPLSRCDTIAGIQNALKVTDAVGQMVRIWADPDPELVLCFNAPDELAQEAWLVTTPTARAAPHIQAFIEFAVPLIAALAIRGRQK